MLHAPPGRWNDTVTGERIDTSFETIRPTFALSAQKSSSTGFVPPAVPSVRWLTYMKMDDARSPAPSSMMKVLVRESVKVSSSPIIMPSVARMGPVNVLPLICERRTAVHFP